MAQHPSEEERERFDRSIDEVCKIARRHVKDHIAHKAALAFLRKLQKIRNK